MPLAFTPSEGVGKRKNRFFIQTSEGLIESYLWNGIELPVKVHEWTDDMTEKVTGYSQDQLSCVTSLNSLGQIIVHMCDCVSLCVIVHVCVRV